MKKKHAWLVTTGIITLLCVCLALSWMEPKMDETRVSVIDVGQGQSILLKQRDTYFLVDCGGDHDGIVADTVANYLMSQGIFRLDGIVLSHYDSDHAGSVCNLLSVVDAECIYIPDISDSNGIREQIESTYPDKIRLIREISALDIPGGTITLYPAKQGFSDNESSVCVLFQAENCDILITGDRNSTGERALLAETELPQLELLVAGHHGSHNATSYDLLLATQPKTVAISVGKNNFYGHPRQEVLDRLTWMGCKIYRTDQQGTIIFRG